MRICWGSQYGWCCLAEPQSFSVFFTLFTRGQEKIAFALPFRDGSKHSSQRRQWHPLHYSCLANPTDRGTWWAAVHGVARSWTRLSDFTFTFHFHALEKEMATHSSVLTWRIPGMGEPGGLLSLGLHRVRHDWSDLAVAPQFWPVGHPWKSMGQLLGMLLL